MVSAAGPSVQAQTPEGPYPFFRSFLDDNMKNIVIEEFLPNQEGASGTDSENKYKRRNRAVLVPALGLQLTYGKEEVGAFYLSDYILTTQDGVQIEFEYIMKYNDPSETRVTDGICMFLVDATNNDYIGSNLKYGAEGAGFGYTNRSSVHQNIGAGVMPVTGMKGAYLGVALDQGNFKNMRFEGYEMRNGISYKTTPQTAADEKIKTHDTRSNITIRGAAGRGTKTITTSTRTHTIPEGSWGFPVLITRHTGSGDNDGTNLRNQAGYELETSTGQYLQQVSLNIDRPFNISGDALFTHAGETAYRKAIITLERNESGGGFKVSVTIQHGTQKTQVIKDYTYPSTLTYRENGVPIRITGTTPSEYNDPPKTGLTLNTPGKLVIGFMASTGQLTSHTNVIKNLRITPMNAANSADDDLSVHRRGPVTMRPLDNDLGYREEDGKVVGKSEYLDPATFRFWEDEYTPLVDGAGKAIFEHEVNEGKWLYDPELAEVKFFPVKGHKGEVSISYDIKGKYSPYSEEKFRSSQAKISVDIDDNQP
jgi:hypothetical protein